MTSQPVIIENNYEKCDFVKVIGERLVIKWGLSRGEPNQNIRGKKVLIVGDCWEQKRFESMAMQVKKLGSGEVWGWVLSS